MANARVLVSDKLDDAGLRVLRDAAGIEVDYRPGLAKDDLCEAIREADALIVRSSTQVTADVLAFAERMRVIGRAGIGVDNIDVPAASRRGIVVMNTPTGNAVTAAEHAVALMFSLARKIPQATASMRQGKWEKSRFEGRELTGKTLGVVGLGNIGRIVATRAVGLKMKVIAVDPILSKEQAGRLGVDLVTFDELLAQSDFVTIHAPLIDSTRGLFNDAAFAKMKKDVLIVNAARGGIVDEAALLRAIEGGRVAGAALDVFEQEPPPKDHPLLGHDRVVLTPHLGASTAEAQIRVAVEIAEQAVAYLRDGIVTNAVNLPALAGEAAERLAPYLRVARLLGILIGQLEVVRVRELRVTCTGEAGEHGVTPIAHAALAGYLERHVDVPVNAVSAPYEAAERGIRVVEVREQAARGYANTIRITVTGDRGIHTATGAIGSKGEPRLIGLEGYEVDALLEGVMLLMRNKDRPGVIGAVGTMLGRRDINVSRVQVSLDEAQGEALALWNVDSEIPEDVLAALCELENVSSVLCVKL